MYENQESSNYNLQKNIFFYLKRLTLVYFVYKFKKFFDGKKTVLDYGCGSGELAVTIGGVFKDKHVYTADVFELEKQFIPNIKKHYLLNDQKFFNEKFDIIIMRHVFEHIYNLEEFLKNIKRNLADKDSLLLIEVPNINSFWRKLMRSRWPGFFYPYHYYVYSLNFLEIFLSHNGFKIIGKRTLEPPIFGSYLLTFGINRSLCKLISILIYPIQIAFSKLFFSSEAVLITVSKLD